jgi:hypothetical protein
MIPNHALFGLFEVCEAPVHGFGITVPEGCRREGALDEGFEARHLFGSDLPTFLAGSDELGPVRETQFPRYQVKGLMLRDPVCARVSLCQSLKSAKFICFGHYPNPGLIRPCAR